MDKWIHLGEGWLIFLRASIQKFIYIEFLNKLFGGGQTKGKTDKRSGAAGDQGVDDGAPGEMGRPVYIPKDEQTLMREKFKLNQFNIMASDKIRLNRTLPDVRMEG